MSNFKRNSSRFSRGGGGSNRSEGSSERRSGGGGYSSRNSRDSDRGESRGGQSRGKGDYAFTKLGTLTVAKSVDDDTKDAILNDMRGNEAIKLNCNVYLPKGVESVELRTGDRLLVDFRVSDKDKEFVVGKISKAND